MEHSIFENLSPEQYRFLLAFLRHRGNLKGVQNEFGISYFAAKSKLDDLLFQLPLTTDEVNRSEKEKAAMISLKFDQSNPKASQIIKAKLLENGGMSLSTLHVAFPVKFGRTAMESLLSVINFPSSPTTSIPYLM